MDTKFVEYMKALRDEMLAESGLVEVKLNEPIGDLKSRLDNSGGRIVRSGFDTWCHSDTCAHNSHDAGQAWEVWQVPQAWVIKDGLLDADSVFYALDPERDRVIMALPDFGIVADRDGGHYANHSFVADIFNDAKISEAAKKLATKEIGFSEFKRIVRENS